MILGKPRLIWKDHIRYWEFPDGRLLRVISGGALPATDAFTAAELLSRLTAAIFREIETTAGHAALANQFGLAKGFTP